MKTIRLGRAFAAAAAISMLAACEPGAGPGAGTGSGEPEGPIYAANVVQIGDDISGARILESDKVYYIDDAVYVQAGASLTIKAGAIVKFGASGKLLVASGGTLIANGSEAAHIVFTSIRDNSAGGDSITNDAAVAPAKGDWYHVWTQPGSLSNSFEYCEFRYGGKDKDAALYVDGKAKVDHCVFSDNLCGLPWVGSEEACLDARNADEGTSITNNVFYRNGWPLAIAADMSLDDSNTFSFDDDNNPATAAAGNDYPAIFVEYREIAKAVSWSETEVAFCVIDDKIPISDAGSLTIGADAAVKFLGTYSGIEIASTGAFSPDTTAVFTSFRDDGVKGDSNGDGGLTAPAIGDWEGIYSDASSSYLMAGVSYDKDHSIP